MKGFYWFCRMLVRVFFALFLPLKPQGADNIPENGAVILCGNHISLLDPLSVAAVAKRTVCFMAKKELFGFALFSAFMHAINAFPVDRKNSDMSAMRTTLAILKDGGVLGIFPQGSREKKGIAPKFETGVGLAAIRTGARVVPVHIIGPYRLFRKNRIVFGPPVELGELYGRTDSGALQEAMRRIETAIFSLS